jgi:hypothetical protein
MKLYGAFSKVDDQADGTLIVSGIASSESVDSDGEVITAAAMKGALPDYMKFGAVREMHQASAAGTAISAKVDDTGKTEFSAHVVDPIAVKKVQTGVYKGFSIGGRVLKRDADNPNTITELRLTEISLVDRPANPDALMQLCKFDDGEGVDATLTSTAAAKAVTVEAPTAPADVTLSRAEPVKKGMYTISTLADLLTSIQYLAQDAEWERAYEGDASDVPAKIRAWLAQGVDVLKDVVAEETSEAIASAEAVALAEKPADVAKVETPAATDVLTKLATLETELAKLAGERDELQKRVTKLEAEPAPPKGVLKVVTKGEDIAEPGKEAEDTEITDEDDALSAMKKVHAAGGVTKLQ